VNTNDETVNSDQYQPGITVDDTTGNVGACWYDRRLDPFNYLVDRFCGVSTDAGATWTNTRGTTASWQPIHGTDSFYDPAYMGDCDTVASDFTGVNAGFIGAFQIVNTTAVPVPNPDVFAVSF